MSAAYNAKYTNFNIVKFQLNVKWPEAKYVIASLLSLCFCHKFYNFNLEKFLLQFSVIFLVYLLTYFLWICVVYYFPFFVRGCSVLTFSHHVCTCTHHVISPHHISWAHLNEHLYVGYLLFMTFMLKDCMV